MKQIIFFAIHPFDVILYSGIVNLLKDSKIRYTSKLIISRHPYFKKTKKIDLFFTYFNEIEYIGYCHYYKNIFAGFNSLKIFIKDIKKIKIESSDIVFFAAASELVSNIFLNYIKSSKAKSILLKQSRDEENNKELLKRNYKLSLTQTIVAWYYIFIGCGSMLRVYKNRETSHFKIRKYYSQPFDYIYNLRNPAYDKINKNEIYFPYSEGNCLHPLCS